MLQVYTEESNESTVDGLRLFSKKLQPFDVDLLSDSFMELKEVDPELLEIDPEKVHAQIESVTTLKSSRNNDQVTQQLNRLKMVAESDDNVMPYIIDCVKNDCTLGGISNSFRSVFGEHNPH
jgi:methylmalonyl-CoA mutase N-terminal domain/subunit